MNKQSSQPKTTDLRNRIMFILSVIGILIAAYVTQSFLRKASIVCVNGGCEAVRKSMASYIVGIPVPAFGLIGYSILAILTFLRTTGNTLHRKLLPWILGIAVGGVAFVSWFTYTELTVIRAICTWCAISTVNMITICILAFLSYRARTTHETDQ